MFVHELLFPVKVLGPGNRIGIWLTGCNKRCPGCASPHLQMQKKEQNIPIKILADTVLALAKAHHIDGVTISGGGTLGSG